MAYIADRGSDGFPLSAKDKRYVPDGRIFLAISSRSTCTLEEVASTGPGIRLQQVYVYKDRNIVEQLMRRAEKAGYKGFVVTVDAPILGRKEANIKNRFCLPPHLALKNFSHSNLDMAEKDSGSAASVLSQFDRSLNWKDVQWLQSITSLPVILKGVNTAEDTKLAIQNGAAAIIVSNHGARQLDYSPATIDCLEEVVKAANGRIPVYLDGGVRRGTDVFKALALGASGVFVGRPVLYSLAADGESGVRKMLQIFHEEFELAMALFGCRSLRDITSNHIIKERDVKQGPSRL